VRPFTKEEFRFTSCIEENLALFSSYFLTSLPQKEGHKILFKYMLTYVVLLSRCECYRCASMSHHSEEACR